MSSILVIDDDPLMQQLYLTIFHKLGHHVMIASNGVEGIEFAFRCEPDLIVCDIAMPEINGFVVMKNIREFEWKFPVKIICISAHPDIHLSIQAGADALMPKPISVKEFMALAHQLLRESHAQ